MYFGNNAGVLEYDGVTWRLIETAKKDVVRSLDIDENGRIYVGASADFGYLAPDAAGQLHYRSLLDYVAPEDRAFNLVWTVHATPEGVYFQTRERIFRFTPDGSEDWEVNVWEPRESFYYAFWLHDAYYVHQRDVGLMKMTDRQLELLPGGAQFAGERLQVLVPFDEGGRLLVGTFNRGLFFFDGRSFQPFETEADGLLRAHTLYRGVVLPDGALALTTMSGGVVILDRTGRMLHHLDRVRGLPGDRVLTLFLDRTGLLWLTPENGICPTEASSPLSRYGAASGLTSFVVKVIRHRGVLYAMTLQGLLYLDATAAFFRPVAGFSGGLNEILDGIEVEGQLLVTSSTGIYQVEGAQARAITQTVPGGASPLVFSQSRRDARRVFVGISNGLASLRRAGSGSWIEEGYIPGIHEYLTHIVEPEPGVLWLGTLSRGALRVRFEDASRNTLSIERFGVEHGLPAGGVSVYEAAGHLVFGTKEGIFRFNAAGRFERDPLFHGVVGFGGSQQTYAIAEDDRGNLWINFGRESAVLRWQTDSAYEADKTALLRFADSPASVIYPEPNGVIWFGGNESLIRYNPGIAKDYAVDFSALIRRVTVRADSLVYGGASVPGMPPLTLRFTENTLRFEYAATAFEQPAETRYRSMLDGFEAGWSAWTHETRRDYTKLPPGTYTFRVQAKNIFEHESAEATYAFAILPPWYRTGWAYAFYLLLGSLGVFFVDRIQRRRLLKRERKRSEEELRRKDRYNEQLRQEVAERTAEVARQNRQLAVQAEKLRALDEAKSRFFANLSHEFRTPLTLTIGPLEDLLAGKRGPLNAETQTDLALALRNSRRQLRLINQLLDVSKLEASEMKLQASRHDLNGFLSHLTLAFTPLAEHKRITFTVDLPGDPVLLYFDPDQLEKVFANLLSNAFKFTPAGGTIYCGLRPGPHTEDDEQPGQVAVVVRDNGPGILPDQLPHIFERFYQTDESTQSRQAGTGIGLALVNELVALHGGEISVESQPGFGTTFTVRLLLGRDHLQETEIVARPAPRTAQAMETGASFEEAGLEAPAGAPLEADDVTTVLVVDDNTDIRRYVRQHLETRYRVVEAADGHEGLDLARAVLPDLVLSDVMMPRMDGYELCQAIKQDPDLAFIPVILLTARVETEAKIEGLREGADDYITKPFNADELVARVDNLIASRRLRARIEEARPAATTTLHADAIEVASADDVFLKQVRTTVEAHIDDSDFNVEQLAAAVGVGRTSLYRRLGALANASPNAVILQIRLERAAQLLAGQAGLVSEVAYAVGFKSVAHFSKRFRDHYGVPPSRYVDADAAGAG